MLDKRAMTSNSTDRRTWDDGLPSAHTRAEMGHRLSTSTSPLPLNFLKTPAFTQTCSALESQRNPPHREGGCKSKGLEPGKLCERQPRSCQEWAAISYPDPHRGPPASSCSHSPSAPPNPRVLWATGSCLKKHLGAALSGHFLPPCFLRAGAGACSAEKAALAQHPHPTPASPRVLSVCHSLTANCHT